MFCCGVPLYGGCGLISFSGGDLSGLCQQQWIEFYSFGLVFRVIALREKSGMYYLLLPCGLYGNTGMRCCFLNCNLICLVCVI